MSRRFSGGVARLDLHRLLGRQLLGLELDLQLLQLAGELERRPVVVADRSAGVASSMPIVLGPTGSGAGAAGGECAGRPYPLR
jgi:hypothetical protein